MSLPTPYTVGLKKHQSGAEDAHGNPVDSWADPVDLKVHGIAPGALQEPSESGRTAVITGLTVLAPSSVASQVTSRDRMVVGGLEYTVEGEVGDWSQGPFDFGAGVEIHLERVSG